MCVKNGKSHVSPTQVGWHKKGTAQVPGQLISLFINKSHWSDNTCSKLISLSKQTCVSSKLFVKTAHVLLLQIDVCWCGPLWRALTCAARFGANLLAYLPLPGELALTCNALYCIPVFDMLSSWREAAVPYFVPFSFFLPKILSKKTRQYYTKYI